MDYKLMPPTRSKAQIICSVITDRLRYEEFDDIIEDLTQEIIHLKPSAKAHEYFHKDLMSAFGKDAYTDLVRKWFKSCYPQTLLKHSSDKDALFAKGEQIAECIVAAYGAYKAGQAIGEAVAEWWNEWNGELDQDFFEWAYELDHDPYYNEEGYPVCM